MLSDVTACGHYDIIAWCIVTSEVPSTEGHRMLNIPRIDTCLTNRDLGNGSVTKNWMAMDVVSWMLLGSSSHDGC